MSKKKKLKACPADKQFGANLGRLLDRLIEEQVTEDRPRADVVSDMGDAAGIDSGTVNQIVAGDINCPPMERLEGFAEVLDVSVGSLVEAAESDGCMYGEDDEEMNRDDEQMNAGEDPDQVAASKKDEETALQTGHEDETGEEEPETVSLQQDDDRVAELAKIEEKFGADVLAQAVRENLSFDQASDVAFEALRAENESLREQAAANLPPEPTGEEPLSGGEVTNPETPSKFSGSLKPAAARQAEYLENCMNGKK